MLIKLMGKPFKKKVIPAREEVPLDPDGKPVRIQLSRKRGWRKPANTVAVSRPSRWGNPFSAKNGCTIEQAVAKYQRWLTAYSYGRRLLKEAKVALRGKHLACWCRPGTPCHADVLLRLVNED